MVETIKGNTVISFSKGLHFERISIIIIAPTYLQPHYGNGGFGNVYLLALDNTKK